MVGGSFPFGLPLTAPHVGDIMSYLDHVGHIRWEKSDFHKHGTIAKYAIGECRCKKCVDRWVRWNPDSGTQARTDNMRQLMPTSRYRKRSRRG